MLNISLPFLEAFIDRLHAFHWRYVRVFYFLSSFIRYTARILYVFVYLVGLMAIFSYAPNDFSAGVSIAIGRFLAFTACVPQLCSFRSALAALGLILFIVIVLIIAPWPREDDYDA